MQTFSPIALGSMWFLTGKGSSSLQMIDSFHGIREGWRVVKGVLRTLLSQALPACRPNLIQTSADAPTLLMLPIRESEPLSNPKSSGPDSLVSYSAGIPWRRVFQPAPPSCSFAHECTRYCQMCGLARFGIGVVFPSLFQSCLHFNSPSIPVPRVAVVHASGPPVTRSFNH